MLEPNSMMLKGSGVGAKIVVDLPVNVKASEGIEPRVFS